jgi:hypothetical protein
MISYIKTAVFGSPRLSASWIFVGISAGLADFSCNLDKMFSQLFVQVALGQPFEPSLEDRSFDGKPVANLICSNLGHHSQVQESESPPMLLSFDDKAGGACRLFRQS